MNLEILYNVTPRDKNATYESEFATVAVYVDLSFVEWRRTCFYWQSEDSHSRHHPGSDSLY